MTSRLPNPFDAAAEPEPEIPEDDPAEALVGRTIAGRYRITGVLGRGGMGVVYSGEHLELERPVAIKVLPGMFSRDSEVLKRFEREARTASKVAHENVVTVYDYGRLESGEPYLIMERLTGRDLDVVLAEKRRLTAEETIDVLVPLAEALDAMHAQGVVHRDIKPSNVFFTSKGTVKLVDFGLAVFRQTGERLTQTGNVVGTAEYMAPEAARGSLVDARGDVYSVATLAYELLTGSLPFSGAPMQVLIDKVSHDPPTMSASSGLSFSAEAEQTMARALSRKPEQRPASVGELVRALRAALESSPPVEGVPVVPRAAGERPPPASTHIEARVPGGRRRTGAWLVAGAIVLVALGLGGGSIMLGGSGPTPEAPQTPVAPPGPALEEAVVAAPAVDTGAGTRAGATTGPGDGAPTEAGAETGTGTAAETGITAAGTGAGTEAGAGIEARAGTGGTAARGRRGARAAATREPSSTPATPTVGATEERRAETTTIAGDAVAPAEGGAERAATLVREAQGALLRGELPRARDLYREATGASPRNAAAWRGLGLVSERMHLEPEAVQAYERYLRIAPSAPDADAIRERVARLSGG